MLQRRDLLTGAILLAAGAAQPSAAVAQAHDMKGMGAMPGMAMSMTDCIDHCLASHRRCLETAAYAVKQGGALASPAMIAMLTDCAELCQATANSMLRGSPLHQVLCRACAEACDQCAEACSKHGADAQMAQCAQTCRTCAEGCREMSR
jgi:hypothetical protein